MRRGDGDICRQRRGLMQLAGCSALLLSVPLQATETRSLVVPGNAEPVSLHEPDQNGFALLPGYQSRVIARSGQRPVSGSDYIWHDGPDGGATIATEDGGWVYVSNAEVAKQGGGVGAIRFRADGTLVDAYSILSGTSRNCAGNMTPWGSYLSCEEVARGQVWECDPLGKRAAQLRSALGHFIHESVVVDPRTGLLYLTEDHPQGRFYRFTAAQRNRQGHPDLSRGLLEVAQVVREGKRYGLVWHHVPDPLAQQQATRYQVKQSTPFRGGEGICYLRGLICFATKGDNRIWLVDPKRQLITVLYDDDHHEKPILSGVDNVVATPVADLLVSEDGGDMQLVTLTLSGQVQAFLQLHGHDRSELTGLAFSPNGRRLYVSSQRGSSGRWSDGVVFEISPSTI